MRSIVYLAAGGLLLALAAAAHSQLSGVDPATGKAAQPVVKPAIKPAVKPTPKPVVKEGETCGDYGTSIEFLDSPREAAAKALKEEKLVFVLHVSGNFEDPTLT